LKPALVENRWLVTAIIMTCKRTQSIAVGLGFFQLRLHSVIPCLLSLPIDVYLGNCRPTNIIKPFQVGHPVTRGTQIPGCRITAVGAKSWASTGWGTTGICAPLDFGTKNQNFLEDVRSDA